MGDACDHIVGLAEDTVRTYFVYVSDEAENIDLIIHDFKYCPMCGMELWDSEVDSEVYKELF